MIWDKKDIPGDLVKSIAAKYGCDLLTASILARRDIITGGEALFFLEDDPGRLRNPFDLPGMEDAVDRILAAKEEEERVLVFGDRDVDGISATALLTGCLTKLGLDVRWRLPEGDDAYGLSIKAVEDFAADSGTLIITVDCGISNNAEVIRAKELGIDVIITDHHNPQDPLPEEALAIVNPKLEGSRYGFRDLAGCGVAYKLASALRFAAKSGLYGHTICLVNTRPVNEAYIIEAVKLRNLAELGRITETVVPGMVKIDETRLPKFLQGHEIFAWDASLQKKTLAGIFGRGVEIMMMDLSAEIGKEIKSVAGMSLLRLREKSKLARYAGEAPGELDVFVSLFRAFIQKREHLFGDDDLEDLQLASLGTLADMMPLRDENRIIVRSGMAGIGEKPRPGISDLIFRLKLSGRPLGTRDFTWQICPALNAAGRMGSPEKAASLFLSKDAEERDKLAGEIISLNEERKRLGDDTWDRIEEPARKSLDDYGGKLVVAATDIRRGLTGIMANRLVQRFKVPALVVSFGEHTCTGSLRSARGYDLTALLDFCADLFLDRGGHDFAAGFSMERSNWPAFLERLRGAAATIELAAEDAEETVTVDAELPTAYLGPDILKLLDRFEPYGEGNPPLVFLARGLRVADLNFMGKGQVRHVKLSLDTGKYQWPAIYWRAAEKAGRDFDQGDLVDLVFTLGRDYFNGQEKPQMVVTDLRRSEG
ncbi:MAG: single-stranded-DNA-specific exonuclease RecJ [Treponema sp.]|jgi:single-stranded-DNA-specific exonuclease|nr:single-stranded-DNA-specific exonuclease RecJ [Treponema sp.]